MSIIYRTAGQVRAVMSPLCDEKTEIRRTVSKGIGQANLMAKVSSIRELIPLHTKNTYDDPRIFFRHIGTKHLFREWNGIILGRSHLLRTN